MFGDRPEHEAIRANLIAEALASLVDPGVEEEAIDSLLGPGVSGVAPSPIGVGFPQRTRSISTRRPRAHIRTPFLEDHYFPRELYGRALELVKDFDGRRYSVPAEIPIGEEFVCWGRRWVVRPSTLGKEVGLGVFACEDIEVGEDCLPSERPYLFPYCGPRYSRRDWCTLSRQCSTYGRYGLRIDLHPLYAFIDGYPPRTGNPGGYINAARGVVGILPNAEWVECARTVQGPRRAFGDYLHPSISHYVMTCATRTIRAGDEVLVTYDYRRTWSYSSQS